jgi:hypothetical protein
MRAFDNHKLQDIVALLCQKRLDIDRVTSVDVCGGELNEQISPGLPGPIALALKKWWKIPPLETRSCCSQFLANSTVPEVST